MRTNTGGRSGPAAFLFEIADLKATVGVSLAAYLLAFALMPVSRCGVCLLHAGQYLRSVSRSGSFRLFFTDV
jgi:hypothetical protein